MSIFTLAVEGLEEGVGVKEEGVKVGAGWGDLVVVSVFHIRHNQLGSQLRNMLLSCHNFQTMSSKCSLGPHSTLDWRRRIGHW